MGIGLKFARRDVCNVCPENRWSVGTWNWVRCRACGVDSNGDAIQDLDDDFVNGPESNCPLGKWAGVVGKTDAELAAETQTNIERQAADILAGWGFVFAKVTSKADLSTALDKIVTVGKLSAEVVAQLKTNLGIATVGI